MQIYPTGFCMNFSSCEKSRGQIPCVKKVIENEKQQVINIGHFY